MMFLRNGRRDIIAFLPVDRIQYYPKGLRKNSRFVAFFDRNAYDSHSTSMNHINVEYFRGGFAIEICGIKYRREIAKKWMSDYNVKLPRKLKKRIFNRSKNERKRDVLRIKRIGFRNCKALHDLCDEYELEVKEVVSKN